MLLINGFSPAFDEQGTLANRPSSLPEDKAGYYYWSTSNFTLYRWDGFGWYSVGVTGGSPGVGYYHTQAVPNAVWTITHNLGYKPGGVYVEDSAGSRHDPWIDYLNNSTLTLTFISSTDGFAILS